MYERFLRDLIRKGPNECWDWAGTKDSKKYGRFNLNRKVHMAHRVSYELFVGPIPKGLVIDHLCNNPSCQNPRHLDPKTIDENARRGKRPTQLMRGYCRNGHPVSEATLYDGKVCKTCKSEYGYKKRAAAREIIVYGILEN